MLSVHMWGYHGSRSPKTTLVMVFRDRIHMMVVHMCITLWVSVVEFQGFTRTFQLCEALLLGAAVTNLTRVISNECITQSQRVRGPD